MRGINAEAQANAPFLMLFVGSALLALGVGVAALFRLSDRAPATCWRAPCWDWWPSSSRWRSTFR